MTTKRLKATHMGELKIGDMAIPCAVLEDGTRVITQRGMYKALGRSGGTGSLAKSGAHELPRFLAPMNIRPFVSEELSCASSPVEFYLTSGGKAAYGYRAEILPDVCSVYLEARDAGKLSPSQLKLAVQCDALVRSFAKVGIVALVDEATGYQHDRERDELHRLLAVYLSEERLKWAKMFPDEFYRQIYRLRGWRFPTGRTQRTPLIGKITNTIVYEKLPPGVLGKLREKNPKDVVTKRKKWKFTQFLSQDIGQPDLQNHLLQVIALMRAATSWKGFIRLLNRAIPTPGEQLTLDIDPVDEGDD